MNDWQKYMPGIGQPITPEALTQGLQMLKGQGATVGDPQAEQQRAGGELASLLERYRENSQAMEGAPSNYAEGSGGLGAAAMMFEGYANKRANEMANAKSKMDSMKGGGVSGGLK